MDPYPSIFEHCGAYNITPQDYLGDDYDTAKCLPGEFFCNHEKIPPLDGFEIEEIKNKLDAFFVRYARSKGVSEEEVAFTYRGLGSMIEPFDRTIRVEWDDWALLSADFVLTLQREVLSEHLLWRILLIGETLETFIIIYPATVRVGECGHKENWVIGIEAAKDEVRKLREEAEQYKKRQLAFLKAKLQTCLFDPDKQTFSLLGVFDNCDGDFEKKSVWLLCSGSSLKKARFYFGSNESPRSVYRKIKIYGVNAKGTINPFYEIDYNNLPYYILEQYSLDKGFTGPLYAAEIKWESENDILKKWPVFIEESQIIYDAELKTP